MKPLDGILFDFDGLILDTETAVCLAWSDVCRSFGLELPLDTWKHYVGSREAFNRYQDLETRLGRAIDRVSVQADFHRRTLAILESEPILPGIEAYLVEATARGLKLGIASNSDRDWVTGHLERLGLAGYFAVIACGNEVPKPKPSPDVYEAAVGALGLHPARAVAIEDSPLGVRAAKGAGLFAVGVPNGMTAGLDFRCADIVVDGLDRLPFEQLVDRFGRS